MTYTKKIWGFYTDKDNTKREEKQYTLKYIKLFKDSEGYFKVLEGLGTENRIYKNEIDQTEILTKIWMVLYDFTCKTSDLITAFEEAEQIENQDTTPNPEQQVYLNSQEIEFLKTALKEKQIPKELENLREKLNLEKSILEKIIDKADESDLHYFSEYLGKMDKSEYTLETIKDLIYENYHVHLFDSIGLFKLAKFYQYMEELFKRKEI